VREGEVGVKEKMRKRKRMLDEDLEKREEI
jgi:hypothetical protein